MSSFENLVSKIIKDAEEKSKEMLENAKIEGDRIVQSEISEGNAQKEEILSQGRLEAQGVKSQIISAQTLEIRDNILKTKQEVIHKTFCMAVEQLNNISEDVYVTFLESYLLNTDISGNEQVVLPDRFKNIDLERINNKLKEHDKIGELKASDSDKKIDGGFILIRDGVENNNTFEALLDYYRDELERIVVDNLF